MKLICAGVASREACPSGVSVARVSNLIVLHEIMSSNGVKARVLRSQRSEVFLAMRHQPWADFRTALFDIEARQRKIENRGCSTRS
jgi:hypothetical protein